MSGKKLFRLILALAVALLTLLSGTQALAASGPITQADVRAVFQSWDTARLAIFVHSRSAAAAQLDGALRGRIPPGADGSHWCVADWHVILVAWITGGDRSFTQQDAFADLSGIGTTFILDGVTLPTEQTPITRRALPLPSSGERDYGFAVGSFLSPTDLTVGAHTLKWVATFPNPDDNFETEATIYGDPAGTGACLR